MTALSEEAFRNQMLEGHKVRGLYELGEALRMLDSAGLPTKAHDVERVECFWLSADVALSSAGFVVALRDQRRAFLQVWLYHDGASGSPPEGEVDVAILPAGQRPPLTDDEAAPLGGWIAGAERHNDFLRRRDLPF